jgi:DNA-binding transcriptional LysR family regulator
MADIDRLRLRRLDLTVLLIFAGLMRTRKATAVAGELGLTQSSVSHGLRRLREVFGDPLFLRRPHGLEPTAVAAALEGPVTAAIEALRGALAGPPAFDPAAFRGTVRIGALDLEQALLLPALVARAEREAPGLAVVGRALVRDAALAALATGELDLALGYFWELPNDFVAEPLFTETYAVATRPETPMRRLDDYVAAAHVVVSPAGDLAGTADAALAAAGLSRRVVAAVPGFFPAFAIAAATGAVATLPRRLAERFGPGFGLAVHPPPLALRPFAVSALRHRRDARSPLQDWLTAVLRPAPAAP